MNRIRFVAEARQEYLAQVAYYKNVLADLGLRFTKELEATVARTMVFPHAGSPSAGGTRRVLLHSFPFALHYIFENNTLVIFAVAHTAREPNYWLSRVPS